MTEDFIMFADRIAAEKIDSMIEKTAGDPEVAHHLADEAIIELLRAVGLWKSADAWERVEPKWYA